MSSNYNIFPMFFSLDIFSHTLICRLELQPLQPRKEQRTMSDKKDGHFFKGGKPKPEEKTPKGKTSK